MAKHPKTFFLLLLVLNILVSCATTSQLRYESPDLDRGLYRETGRAFLVETQIEEPGYGLYSYLLFGSRPSNPIVRDRYLQAINSYINIIEKISDLKKYIPPQELNITYLPLNLPPPPKPSAEWILDHYNYARAKALLRALDKSHQDGLYIISALKPLGAIETTQDKYLLQDMSSVPPHLVTLWVKEFISQTAKERFWEEETTKRLVLELRKTIGIMANGLPEVQTALKGNIAWLKNLASMDQ